MLRRDISCSQLSSYQKDFLFAIMAGVSLGWCHTYSEKEPPLPLLPSPLPPAPELLCTKGFLVSSAEWSVDERSTALREREREREVSTVFLRVLLVCNLCRTDAFLHFDMLVSSYFLQLIVMILIPVFSSLMGALCLLKQRSFYYRYKRRVWFCGHTF